MHLGDRLRNARTAKGLTQTELAEPEYTAAYVSTIEAGRRNPSRAALEHFARKLGMDPDELATGNSRGLRAELEARYLEERRKLSRGEQTVAEEAHAPLERLARRAEKVNMADIAIKARIAIGAFLENEGKLEEAIGLYERLLDQLQDESPIARVDATASLARALQTRGDTALAAFLLEKLLAELERSGLHDPSSLVRLHASLVAAYHDKGLTTLAVDSASIALQLAPQVDDAERLGNLNLNVGILLKNQRQWKDAERRLAEAERWFDHLGFESERGRVYLAMGLGLRERARYSDARKHLNRAAQIFSAAGNVQLEARTLLALGILERLDGNTDQARFLLKRSLAQAGDDTGAAGMAHRELGLCDAATDKAKAVKQIRRAIALLETSGNAKELAGTYRELGNVLSGHKDHEPACDAYRRAADLFETAA